VQKKKKIKKLKGAPRRGSFGEHLLTKARAGTRLTSDMYPFRFDTHGLQKYSFLSRNLEDLPRREGLPMERYCRRGGVVVEADILHYLALALRWVKIGGLSHDFPTYLRRRPTLILGWCLSPFLYLQSFGKCVCAARHKDCSIKTDSIQDGSSQS